MTGKSRRHQLGPERHRSHRRRHHDPVRQRRPNHQLDRTRSSRARSSFSLSSTSSGVPMLRSLSSAVSGLRNQQTRMDVIGNNVSNVNTVAFKAGRVTFKEGFAQLVESASAPDRRHRRHQPDAGRTRLADRQHRHDVHAGQSRDDGPKHRPRDSGQLVLRASRRATRTSTRAPATSRSTRTARSSPASTATRAGPHGDERQAERRR